MVSIMPSSRMRHHHTCHLSLRLVSAFEDKILRSKAENASWQVLAQELGLDFGHFVDHVVASFEREEEVNEHFRTYMAS